MAALTHEDLVAQIGDLVAFAKAWRLDWGRALADANALPELVGRERMAKMFEVPSGNLDWQNPPPPVYDLPRGKLYLESEARALAEAKGRAAR